MTTTDDDLLGDAIEALLADACPPAAVRAIEAGGPWAPLWDTLETSGFCDALVPEAHGGAGLALRELFPLFEACGRHALPLPLAQTIAARAVLAGAGHALPAGPIALATAPSCAEPVLVACGAVASFVLLQSDDGLRLLATADAKRDPVGDGSPDARLHWPAAATDATAARVAAEVDLRAFEATLLAAQLAGAMRRVFAMTLAFANDRQQFGRSIGKFQAIQHQLAVMAEETEAARIAARLGCETSGAAPATLPAALAKARTSEAAVQVAAIAHAVHGAIGITQEFDLQLLTRRLLAWRVAAGSESYWNAHIGRALLASGQGVPDFVRLQLAAA